MRTSGLSAAAVLWSASAALGGGTPENILLIIDPTIPASLHIGNEYKKARGIPDRNVLYLRSQADTYAQFRDTVQLAFQGTLAQRGIASKIDYVVLAPTDVFYVPANGMLSGDCWPPTRISVTTAYTLSQISSSIVPNTPVSTTNMFYSTSDFPIAFSSTQGYLNGSASASGTARRYYIASMLGYTGAFGNSVQQLLSLIERSVAADGSRPAGTFYYMNNTADTARNVRHPQFPAAISAITSRGGVAQQLNGVLPLGQNNVLGIMTGVENATFPPAGNPESFTILPGAFADHLTSYAATFDVTNQTKLTAWITLGASGSAGTVDEPCNYTEKFPHARFHVWYLQGMSLGECYLRGQAWLPFQNLLYGDPMTRPFARFPTVNVTNAPAGPVGGVIPLTVASQATAPGAIVSTLELLVDSQPRGLIAPSVTTTFSLDTLTLDDGWHDVRVLARDSTTTRNIGRWAGSIIVNNYGRSATLGVSPTIGDLSQAFTFTPTATGGSVRRVQLVQNGRVIAASAGLSPMTVWAPNLGAGTSRVHAEVTFADNRVARSAPIEVRIGYTGVTGSATPVVFDSAKAMSGTTVHAVELPAAFPDAVNSGVTYTLLSTPTQATVLNPSFTGPYRLIRPNANASGQETLQYRATSATGQSSIGTVRLIYTPPAVCLADFNVDGTIDADDLGDYINAYFGAGVPQHPAVDFNRDGSIDGDDLGDFINEFFGGTGVCS